MLESIWLTGAYSGIHIGYTQFTIFADEYNIKPSTVEQFPNQLNQYQTSTYAGFENVEPRFLEARILGRLLLNEVHATPKRPPPSARRSPTTLFPISHSNTCSLC